MLQYADDPMLFLDGELDFDRWHQGRPQVKRPPPHSSNLLYIRTQQGAFSPFCGIKLKLENSRRKWGGGEEGRVQTGSELNGSPGSTCSPDGGEGAGRGG